MWLYQFDSLTIDNRGGSDTLSAGEVSSSLLRLPGDNAFDWRGADRGYRIGQRLPAQGYLVAASEAALLTDYNAWQARIGERATLSRIDHLGNVQTITARLMKAPVSREPHQILHLPLDLEFELVEPYWRGTLNTVTTVLDVSPKNFNITNAGNHPVRNVLIGIKAKSVAITWLALLLRPHGAPAWETWINFDGTIGATKELWIVTSQLSVLNDGANAYKDFQLNSQHQHDDWVVLAPGVNNVSLTRTGGAADSELLIQWRDGWA